MKKIDIDICGRMHSYEMPERWEELTQEQFVRLIDALYSRNRIDSGFIAFLLGMEETVADCLLPIEWWSLEKQLGWMQELTDIDIQYMETLTLKDGTVCYGYEADFDNVTWEEWMFCDTMATRGQWATVAAVLFRPEVKNWDGECDRRIPFSKYGAGNRLSLFQELPKEVLKAIEINYVVLRQHMTDKYRHIFFDEEYDDEEEGEKEKQEKRKPADWVTVVRNMMGDNFFEQDKYLRLPVNTVLFQLNRMVKENNERKLHNHQ